MIAVDKLKNDLVQISTNIVVLYNVHDIEIGLALSEEVDAFLATLHWGGFLLLSWLLSVDNSPD